jgi:hypothetical protein
MNFISLNSNWKFELNKSIGKKGIVPGRPNLETGPPPFPPPMAHRPIPATTGDEVGQGVTGEEA